MQMSPVTSRVLLTHLSVVAAPDASKIACGGKDLISLSTSGTLLLAAVTSEPGGDSPWPRGEHLERGTKARGGMRFDFLLGCATLRFQNISCSLLGGFVNFFFFFTVSSEREIKP